MDLWTRENIKNYTGDPDESSDINYSKKQQEIRRAIRAFEAGQYSSAIGALKLIWEMTLKEQPKKDPRWHGNFKH